MVEVPVGFKWFVPGLIDGSFGFGGEESAGASFLRTRRLDLDHRQGRPPAVPAGLRDPGARPARRPSEHYAELVATHGDPAYARVDAPANREQKAKLAALSPDDVTATELAGEPITAKLTEAPGNGAKIGGLKVTTENAWFAARPSRHRGRLQDLRRVVPGPRPPRRGPGRGARGRLGRPGFVGIAGAQLSCVTAHRAVSATTGSASSVKRSARSRASSGRAVGAA